MNIYVKHPRIYHIPDSLGISSDDKTMKSLVQFKNKDIVISLKLDGENWTFYNNYCHSRSINSSLSHPSHDWAKAYHQTIKHKIPDGWRICGENLFAKHTIYYQNLKSYFYVHSIWDENNICLFWTDTMQFCQENNFELVPTLYMGKWDEKRLNELKYLEFYNRDLVEGFVLRILDKIPFSEYNESVCKYVREEFRDKINDTVIHWTGQKLIKNKLKEKQYENNRYIYSK